MIKHHGLFGLPHKFFIRLARSIFIAFIIIVIALFIGMLGYHVFEKMPWIDAFANAAMILSGMGPFSPLSTPGGKLFAGFYALFSGLIFIVMIGIIIAPVVHHFLHRFRIEDDIEVKRKQ